MCTSSKLEAVECTDKSSKEAAAREFGVDAKRIRLWCSLILRSLPPFLYGDHIKMEAGK